MADPTYDTAGNLNTARVTAHKRQPDVMDYAQNSQFRVTFSNFPLAEYFCTTAVIPGISLGVSNVGTRLSNMPIVGDQISYDNFDMTFLVDEELKNYREIHDWMVSIGFPYDHKQFKSVDRRDDVNTRRGERMLYDDIMLTVLSSKNNPVVRIKMLEAFPIALSGLTYTQAGVDVEYLTADVTFTYMTYEFKTI